MGIVGGGRGYSGGQGNLGGGVSWRCPSCQTLNKGPLEGGCRNCGAGTSEEAARAKVAGATASALPSMADLLPFLVEPGPPNAPERLRMGVALGALLTPRARLIMARALAMYAEEGAPSAAELNRLQILGWARAVAATVDDPTEEKSGV